MTPGQNQIAKPDRLKKRSDFLHVQKKGRKWVSRSVIVQAAENEGLGRRLGLTVTKKVSKSAVVRNRIKRRLRAAADDIMNKQAADNHDYVLIGRVATEDYPYKDLLKDLEWCLKRLDLRSA